MARVTYIIHQSDLASWARCPESWRLEKAGARTNQLSATAYGTVVHHALHVGARLGNDVQVALDTFNWYWHPHHIEALTEPVDTWLPTQSYSSLRVKGNETIKRFFDLLPNDSGRLLALEFEFIVPLEGVTDPLDGSTVMLAGTIDRLLEGHYYRRLTVRADDLKTGKRKTYLRHNPQGTAYCLASTLPEFWMGNPEFHTEGFGDEGRELYLKYAGAARKFNWVDLKDCAWIDGGFRGPKDYARFKHGVQQMVNSVRAEIFPLTMAGEVCQFCPARDVCAGVGLDEDEGDPRRKPAR